MLALVLLIFVLPHLLHGHGCDTFTFSEDRTFLNSGFLPESFKDFVAERNSSTFSGVNDCHQERGDNEVAVNVICDSKTKECICETLFQFKPCQSCSPCANLSTIEYDQDIPRWVYSFSATCNDIDEEYPACSVECGFATKGCYPEGNSSGLSSGKSSGKRLNHLGYQSIILLSVLLFMTPEAVSNIF